MAHFMATIVARKSAMMRSVGSPRAGPSRAPSGATWSMLRMD